MSEKINATEAALLLDVSRQTIKNWCQDSTRGFPAEKINGCWMIDREAAVAWKGKWDSLRPRGSKKKTDRAALTGQTPAEDDVEEKALSLRRQKLDLRKAELDVEKREIDNAIKMGQLVPKGATIAIVTTVAHAAKQRFLAMADRLPPLLVNKPEATMRELLRREVTSVLEMMHEMAEQDIADALFQNEVDGDAEEFEAE